MSEVLGHPSHVKSWGVIDQDKGTYVIKATCRRCGDHGEFATQQEVQAFKDRHTDGFNRCPHEKEVIY